MSKQRIHPLAVDHVIVKDSRTPKGQEVTAEEIIEQHTAPIHSGGLGLNRPRIDELIHLDGSRENIIPPNNVADVDLWGFSLGDKGLKGKYKVIEMVGGLTKTGDKDYNTFSDEQNETLIVTLKEEILRNPKVTIWSLEDAPNMGGTNPSFNLKTLLTKAGIDKERIFIQPKDE